MRDAEHITSSEVRLLDHESGEERVYLSIEDLPPEARELLDRAMRGAVDAQISKSESYVIENPDGSSHEFTSMGEAMQYIGARTGMDVEGPLFPGTRVYVNRAGVRTQVSLGRGLSRLGVGVVVIIVMYAALKLGWITP